jgi:hypothetical protein
MTSRIEIGEDGVSVDAAILAEAFALEPAEVPALMRAGEITSLFERGEGEDAGRMRLTFFHRSRRFRLVVDEAGEILQRSRVDFGDAPLPPSMRRPG